MKIEQLREKLRKNNKVQPTKEFADIYEHTSISNIVKMNNVSSDLFRSSLGNKQQNENQEDTKMKIIGITGSHGKSSVAFMIHEYLKQKGYKSILYSSVSIDSPASFNKPNEAVENPLRDEQMLLNAIEEAYAYNTDYLVLEVNERAIKRGLTKDIPFDLRIITNINPTHNTFFYSDYVQIKIQFFQEVNADDNVICLFNANDKEIFNSLYESNSKQKVIYMSKYVKEKRGLASNKVNYLLTANQVFDTINGLQFIVKSPKNDYNIETKMLFPHNGLNITCVIASLETLGIFDYQLFSNFIKCLSVPGTDEVFDYQNRKIIITRAMSPHLETLYKYKIQNQISRIHLVAGASGLGYKSWIKEFSDDATIKEKEYSIGFAYKYAEKYADKIYFTTSDSGATNKEELLNYQASFVNDNLEKEIVLDRQNAISIAFSNSQENDVIIITGRGNRRIMCDSLEGRKLHLDSDVVRKIIISGGRY